MKWFIYSITARPRAPIARASSSSATHTLVMDNLTAVGIANDTVKQKCSKAMEMRFYWIRNRVRQGQFVVYPKRGATNKADYFSKYHGTPHHRGKRYDYLKQKTATN
jgi:hypothetical protein